MKPWMLPMAALAAVEGAVNSALALDPETVKRMAGLEGKVLAVEIRMDSAGSGLSVYAVPTSSGLRLMGHFEGDEPDAVVSGTPLSLLRLLSREGDRDVMDGTVEVRGDVELARTFRRILMDMDVDWEEQMSRFTGDIVAHQMGNVVRGLGDWGRGALNNLRMDVSDYLTEEREFVPRRQEVEAWMNEVDTLRDDVERLAARIFQLKGGA